MCVLNRIVLFIPTRNALTSKGSYSLDIASDLSHQRLENCTTEPWHDKTSKISVSSEDSDHPRHVHSLFRVFAMSSSFC